MKKTAIFLAVLMLFSCTAFAAGEVFSISVSHTTYAEESTGLLKQKIEVLGEAPLSLAGKNIGLAVIRPGATAADAANPIDYLAAGYQSVVKADGSYEFVFEFDDVDGEYTFTVFTDTLETLVSVPYELPSVSFINDFLSAVDAGSITKQEMAESITADYAKLGIDVSIFNELSDAAKEAICEKILSYDGTININNFFDLYDESILIEGVKYSEGEDIKMITEAYESTLQLSQLSIYEDYSTLADKSQVFELMEGNTAAAVEDIKELFFESAFLALCKEALSYQNILPLLQKYRTELNEPAYLSELESRTSEQTDILNEVGAKLGNMSGIDELEKAFNDALAVTPDTGDNDPPAYVPPAGGGGGGGGGNVHTVTPEEKNEEVSDIPEPVITTVFSDLAGYEWAKEAITTLSSGGILSGNGKGFFFPANNITRAEFVKILTGVLKLSETGGAGNMSFSDVNESDWYYSYVNTAVSNGIVLGKSDTYFGASDYISRQDMATLIYRALTKLNKIKPLDTVNKKYSDYQDISDYAKNSILMLSEYGIISGYEDGTFRPFGNAARAEAAQLVYNVSLFTE